MSEYIAHNRFDFNRPLVLVVSCSDGRLQLHVDEFLERDLGIFQYDRLYLPGGPGALASSGFDSLRSSQQHKEFEFLVESHQIEDVIFLFHGPGKDGPVEALCVDYKRKLPRATADEIRRQQENDAKEIIRFASIRKLEPRLHFYRCEVRTDNFVQFVRLTM
jgi:hypothetical protein